jgi:hypothetical protein
LTDKIDFIIDNGDGVIEPPVDPPIDPTTNPFFYLIPIIVIIIAALALAARSKK